MVRPKNNAPAGRLAFAIIKFLAKGLAAGLSITISQEAVSEDGFFFVRVQVKRGRRSWERYYYDLTNLALEVRGNEDWPLEIPAALREKPLTPPDVSS